MFKMPKMKIFLLSLSIIVSSSSYGSMRVPTGYEFIPEFNKVLPS